MRKQSEILELECPLTEKEHHEYLVKLSELTNNKKTCLDIIEQKKRVYIAERTNLKRTIRGIDEAIVVLNKVAQSRKEMRLVECAIIYDFKSNVKMWIRTDNVEPQVVKETEIPEEDLQEDLSIDTVAAQ